MHRHPGAALRNAGWDLQREIHEDALRKPKLYPLEGKAPDANIDHRRIRMMLPWFNQNLVKVAADAPYLPGDIVLFDTFPTKPAPITRASSRIALAPRVAARRQQLDRWLCRARDGSFGLGAGDASLSRSNGYTCLHSQPPAAPLTIPATARQQTSPAIAQRGDNARIAAGEHLPSPPRGVRGDAT